MLHVIGAADQREMAKRNFDRALGGEWLTLVEEYGDAQNRTFYENRYSPIMEADGEVTGLTVFVLDISGRMRAEEQLRCSLQQAEALTIQAQEGSRAKSEFLSVISHELLTPLNGVLGIAGVLGATPLDADQQDLVQSIHDSGERLLRMVNNILSFSSIDKDGIRLNASEIVLCEMLEICCGTIQETVLKKGLKFSLETAPGLPEKFTGDEQRIRQILIHLLDNAAKFTARGTLHLCVSPTREGEQRFLDFAVKDTGPGIAIDTLGLLFNPFVQADSSLRRSFEGIGLGLAISQRLAESMHGTISVVSTPGHGSTFTFRLPLA
ncbi:MAG: ATP-binding protein [Verrucomicrobiota bacterium]